MDLRTTNVFFYTVRQIAYLLLLSVQQIICLFLCMYETNNDKNDLNIILNYLEFRWEETYFISIIMVSKSRIKSYRRMQDVES